MPINDDPTARLIHLAGRLAEQTRAGRISWSPSTNGRRYTYAGASGSVTVERDQDLVGNIVMRVRDQNGVTVEELVTTATPGALVGVAAHRALIELYNAIAKSSRHVIDGLIAEIG